MFIAFSKTTVFKMFAYFSKYKVAFHGLFCAFERQVMYLKNPNVL